MPLKDPPGEFCETFPGRRILGKEVLPLIIPDVKCEALLSEVKSADDATETNESLTEASTPRYDRPGVAVPRCEPDVPSSAIDSEAGAMDTRRKGWGVPLPIARGVLAGIPVELSTART